VVIVGEKEGWLADCCTKPPLPVQALVEAMADRGVLEQLFHDVKEVGGAGQQQVRNVFASIGAFTVNVLLYSMVAAWAWWHGEETLVERSGCRWGSAARRPSHAGKRKAVQGEILSKEIQAVMGQRTKREQFQELAIRLLQLAA
jgi:hypothetical protein